MTGSKHFSIDRSYYNWLCMGLHSCRFVRVPMLTTSTVYCWKHLQWSSLLDHGGYKLIAMSLPCHKKFCWTILKCWVGFRIPQISIWLSICEMCWPNKCMITGNLEMPVSPQSLNMPTPPTQTGGEILTLDPGGVRQQFSHLKTNQAKRRLFISVFICS